MEIEAHRKLNEIKMNDHEEKQRPAKERVTAGHTDRRRNTTGHPIKCERFLAQNIVQRNKITNISIMALNAL